MIGKVTRGWRAGGLIRYLLGPGRFNEHRDPHVVATWDGAPERRRPLPTESGGGERGLAGLAADLAADVAAAQVAAGIPEKEPAPKPDGKGGMRVPRGPVWHCSLRNHADDRVLSDAEWSEVIEEVLDRTGIARRDDPFGCRWVAIRHADDHVHIVAVLVRTDTFRRVHPRHDYLRLREVCREFEDRWGLTLTGDADGTASCHPTRAEMEKATRHAGGGHGRPARVRLCEEARRASLQAHTPEGFLEVLAARDVLVRVHRDRSGAVDGYALALPGDLDAAGAPVWFSGSRLARDLSMPRLRAQWAAADPPPDAIPAAPGERSRTGRAERTAAVEDATQAVEEATEALQQASNGEGGGLHDEPQQPGAVREPANAKAAGGAGPVHDAPPSGRSVHDATSRRDRAVLVAGVSHSLRELLVALDLTARDAYPELGDAALLFDRAARTPRTILPRRWTDEARHLRAAAWRLAAVRSLPGRGHERAPLAALVAAIATLIAELAAHQSVQQRLVQARAAHRCATALNAVGGSLHQRAPASKPSGSDRSRPQQEGAPVAGRSAAQVGANIRSR